MSFPTAPWFEVAFAPSPNGMLLLDSGATIRKLNAAVARMFGWRAHELLGCPVELLVAPRARRKLTKVRERFERQAAGNRIRRTAIELVGLHRDGREFPIAVAVGLIVEAGAVSALISVTDLSRRKRTEARLGQQNEALRDAVMARTAELETINLRLQTEIEVRRRTERELLATQQRLREMNEELRRLAMVDGLTGLANRRHFDSRFRIEYQRAVRAGTPLAVVLLDIDHFKALNDSLGHAAGDDCLRQIARTVARCLRRPADLIARWGGEEFAALLPDTPQEGAVQIARAMRVAVRTRAIENPGAPGRVVTVSAGVACLEGGIASARALLEAADRALYTAKERGRDRVCVATRGRPRRAAAEPEAST